MTQESFHGLKVKSIISLSIISYTTIFQRTIVVSVQKISKKNGEREHWVYNWNYWRKMKLCVRKLSEITKSKFVLKVGRTTIVKILKQNGYMYKHADFKVKNEQPQQQIRENWRFCHMHATNFDKAFFTDQIIFYLANQQELDGLKMRKI